MTRPDFPRSILEFQARFADEEACRRYLFESRWPDGFCCPRCGGGSAGEQPKRRLWECRDCGHQTSVTAGTVMHGTRTALQVWFWAAIISCRLTSQSITKGSPDFDLRPSHRQNRRAGRARTGLARREARFGCPNAGRRV